MTASTLHRAGAATLLILVVIAAAAYPKTIYVDDDAAGANNGSSWTNAYNYLQDALGDANAATKPVEIRIAAGTYKPDLGNGITPGDRNPSFPLISQVCLKGGYAGVNEPEANARDIISYETILSGDLAGDDGPDFANNTENSYHVLTAFVTDSTAVIDGVTVTAGNANHEEWSQSIGAGMYSYYGSTTIRNCTFIANYAGNDDGGGQGGAIYNRKSNPTITDCGFIRNWAVALDGGGDGGAIFNRDSNPIITNCAFIANTAGTEGGAVWSSEGSIHLTNCLFSGNFARRGPGGKARGGAFYSYYCKAYLANCTFTGNAAKSPYGQDAGGAIRSTDSSQLTLVNCILWANDARLGPQIALKDNDSDAIGHSLIQGGLASIHLDNAELNWESGNLDTDPCFVEAGSWYDNETPDDPTDDRWTVGDCHLKSQGGRSDPETGEWVRDDTTSPCIDAGDPRSAVGFEVFPNGGIVNMGAYGGTAEASKSYFGGPACETIVGGDINGDCKVDFTDFAIMGLHWLDSTEF
jgi:hypothetical protein